MAAKMTQSQMVKELAAAVGVPAKVAKSFTTAYAEMAVRETKKSGVCVLPGIGRLVRVDRKARMGRNPATGEAIKIPAKKVVKFRERPVPRRALCAENRKPRRVSALSGVLSFQNRLRRAPQTAGSARKP